MKDLAEARGDNAGKKGKATVDPSSGPGNAGCVGTSGCNGIVEGCCIVYAAN